MSLGAGTHILDLDRNANFKLTLSGNITLANPANLTAGTTGSIFVVQDGTGSRTASFGTSWGFHRWYCTNINNDCIFSRQN